MQRTYEQKPAITAFLTSTIEMTETFLDITVTARETEVKTRMLGKVQRNYLRICTLVNHVDDSKDLLTRIEAVKRRPINASAALGRVYIKLASVDIDAAQRGYPILGELLWLLPAQIRLPDATDHSPLEIHLTTN